MKLIAIFVCWDDYYLLQHSLDNIWPVVDDFIIVASEMSNFGEPSPIPDWVKMHNFVSFEPKPGVPAMNNETAKRNAGLDKARELGATHFIVLDSDELYKEDEFKREKEKFDDPNLQGLVCRTQVYFKEPTLTIGLDTTLVPFIHKLTPTIHHTFNRLYPFAWEGLKNIRIDPTRSLSITSGVDMSPIIMHHYSYVRKDYKKKIRNSTAKGNLERSSILEDLLNAKEGEMCHFYNKPLVRVPNWFNIPSYGVGTSKDLQ